MDIVLYNTLSRRKEQLKPLKKQIVGVYSCGPTVYNRAHIGNLKAYIFADTLCRVLAYNKFQVKQVMNITDVGHLVSDADEGEDKIEKAAREQGKNPWEIAAEFTRYFVSDCAKLNITPPAALVQATAHIPEMIAYVKVLLAKGYAYETSDGIYFDISKYPEYGQLSGIKLEEQQAGARIAVNSEKRNPYDFAVWKNAEKSHIMQWESPWGMGYPGWHLECSVLSRKYLGDVFDIHTGGIDHIPIHHENEIAQSIGYCGKIPANIWMHSGFLQINKGKMSKSLGNVYTLDDLAARKYDPLAYRYMCLNAHYRKQLNFTWEGLDAAQTALNRLRQAVSRLATSQKDQAAPTQPIAYYVERFHKAINDDLNIPLALAVVWDFVRSGHQGTTVIEQIKSMDSVLALNLFKHLEDKETTPAIPPEVEKLVTEREAARKAKQWQKADQLRAEILAQGYQVIDTKDGPQIKAK